MPVFDQESETVEAMGLSRIKKTARWRSVRFKGTVMTQVTK